MLMTCKRSITVIGHREKNEHARRHDTVTDAQPLYFDSCGWMAQLDRMDFLSEDDAEAQSSRPSAVKNSTHFQRGQSSFTGYAAKAVGNMLGRLLDGVHSSVRLDGVALIWMDRIPNRRIYLLKTDEKEKWRSQQDGPVAAST
jgi:hypothetical protein